MHPRCRSAQPQVPEKLQLQDCCTHGSVTAQRCYMNHVGIRDSCQKQPADVQRTRAIQGGGCQLRRMSSARWHRWGITLVCMTHSLSAAEASCARHTFGLEGRCLIERIADAETLAHNMATPIRLMGLALADGQRMDTMQRTEGTG